MLKKKRKVYEIAKVNEATGKIRFLTRVNDGKTAQHIRKFVEGVLIDLGAKNPRIVIIERDAEDDAEKTTEGVCGH